MAEAARRQMREREASGGDDDSNDSDYDYFDESADMSAAHVAMGAQGHAHGAHAVGAAPPVPRPPREVRFEPEDINIYVPFNPHADYVNQGIDYVNSDVVVAEAERRASRSSSVSHASAGQTPGSRDTRYVNHVVTGEAERRASRSSVSSPPAGSPAPKLEPPGPRRSSIASTEPAAAASENEYATARRADPAAIKAAKVAQQQQSSSAKGGGKGEAVTDAQAYLTLQSGRAKGKGAASGGSAAKKGTPGGRSPKSARTSNDLSAASPPSSSAKTTKPPSTSSASSAPPRAATTKGKGAPPAAAAAAAAAPSSGGVRKKPHGASVTGASAERESWFLGKANPADVWGALKGTPHETFAVIKTQDNKKYLVIISNQGWPVIFSVINLGGGKVRAAEDGTEYASLFEVVHAMRECGVSPGKGGGGGGGGSGGGKGKSVERLRPSAPLDGCFFHRSAAWVMCRRRKVSPKALANHAWWWSEGKERGEKLVSKGRPGDFLVRPSHNANVFVLCVNAGEGHGVVRLQIKRADGKFSIADRFEPSLAHIVESIRTKSITAPSASKGAKPIKVSLSQCVRGAALHSSAFRAVFGDMVLSVQSSRCKSS